MDKSKDDPKAAEKAYIASAKANSDRCQPGVVETTSSGQRVIHPAANPQQVNPLHDPEHEAAAVNAAHVLTDKEATPAEKNEAVAKSNEAEGAPSAIATKAHEQAQKDDRKHNAALLAREEERKKNAAAAHKKANS